MKSTKIHFSKVPQFSKIDIAYSTQNPKLRPFYLYAPTIESFGEAIENRKDFSINRPLLQEGIRACYNAINIRSSVAKNIELLGQENTFTITTGHQPSLFTGPLYFIYKIVTIIKLCKQLKSNYPSYNFVPIYWMGSEDHDFEEMNHLQLFGKEIVWQSNETGAVGRMQNTHLSSVIEEIESILGNSENAHYLIEKLKNAFHQNQNYGQGMLQFVDDIFGDLGLITLLADQRKWKAEFKSIINQELFERSSEKIVNDTISELQKTGFKAQAKPRAINLFYLNEGIRERIIFEDQTFKVNNTDIVWTKEEMQSLIKNKPECFSPNVILRPIYQELLLPNLAYIGGGGEIAYWLERKAQFEHFNIPFPMLIRRCSALWVSKTNHKKLQKLGLDIPALSQDYDLLIKTMIKNEVGDTLDFSIEKNNLTVLFEDLIAKVVKVDSTLEKSVRAELAKAEKGINQLENRVLKSAKRKEEERLNQIKNLREKLFPKNGLQERKENFLQYYAQYGENFLIQLMEHLEPLSPHLFVLTEED